MIFVERTHWTKKKRSYLAFHMLGDQALPGNKDGMSYRMIVIMIWEDDEGSVDSPAFIPLYYYYVQNYSPSLKVYKASLMFPFWNGAAKPSNNYLA